MKTSILHLSLAVFLCAGLAACGGDKAAKAPEAATEEKEEHGEEESAIVSLTEEQMRTVGITLGTPEQRDLAGSIKVAGVLEVPAQNKASVTSLYSGVLQSLRIQPGQYVRKGQAIGTVVNTELSGIQQQLISVNAQLKLAVLEETRQRELVAGQAAPLKNLQRAQAELSSLRAQQSALRNQLSALGVSAGSVSTGNISSTLTITAPVSGTVSEINAQIGAEVNASTPVATIVDNSALHLDLFVYEKDLPSVRVGQEIHFTMTNNPAKEYDAEIFSVGTAFTDASKSVAVHARVKSDKTGLIEGMGATAYISAGGGTTATAVPDEAIVNSGGKYYIFIRADKKAEEHGHEEGEEEGGHEEGDHKEADHAEEGHKEGDHKEGEHNEGEPGSKTVNFERIEVARGTSEGGFTAITPVQPLPANAQVVVKGAFFIIAKMTNTGEHSH